MIQALKLSMSWGYETFTWFVYFWKQQFSVCRIFMCTEKGEQLTPHLKSLFSLVFAKSIWGVGKGREYEGSLQGESSYYAKAFIVSPAQLEFVSVQTPGCSSHIPKGHHAWPVTVCLVLGEVCRRATTSSLPTAVYVTPMGLTCL